jgi:hypothetical protein
MEQISPNYENRPELLPRFDQTLIKTGGKVRIMRECHSLQNGVLYADTM